MTDDPHSDPHLEELVLDALELLSEGQTPDYAVLCSDRPDLISAVREAVEMASELPAIHSATVTGDLLVGSVFAGRYELRSRLGAGAMGVVYAAWDKDLGRDVAVKCLRAGLMDTGQATSRFEREAEVMAAVQHSAVITVFDRGHTDQGDPYLVMELLEGATLADLMEGSGEPGEPRGPEDWSNALVGSGAATDPEYLRNIVRWTARLAGGLQAIHNAGIYHRDVKPSNVFVRADGRPVLLDFGIAARSEAATLTEEGSTLGTPAYMAPECLSAGHQPSVQQDVYSLAATLYFLITRQAPYTGSPTQVLHQLMLKEPKPAGQLVPGLPVDLQAILDCAMDRAPGRRYPNAAGFEADLLAFLDHRPVSARPISAARRLARRAKRSKPLLAGALVGIGGLVLLGGWEVRKSWRAERSQQSDEALVPFPANMVIAGHHNRVCSDPEEKAFYTAALNRAVDLSIDPLPSRLYRSSFRFDHGDPVGAAADIAAIARHHGTAYSGGLAAVYAALPEDAQLTTTIPLEDLPEPVSAMDHFLHGYHLLRARNYLEAHECFLEPGLEDFAPAVGYELMTLPVVQQWKDTEVLDRRVLADALYERVVLLEERQGRSTATSMGLASVALLFAQRFDQANEVCDEGLALAPYSFLLLGNKGKAAHRLGDFGAALEALDKGLALRPKDVAIQIGRVLALVAEARFDDAKQAIETGDFSQSYASYLMGGCLGEQAVHAHSANDTERAIELATQSLENFDRSKKDDLSMRVTCLAIVSGDEHQVYQGIMRQLAKNPGNWWKLRRALPLAPTDPTPEDMQAIAAFHEALAQWLAGSKSTWEGGTR